MPTIRVMVPAGAWSKEEKGKVATELTETLNRVAQEVGKGDIKPYVNAQIEEAAEGGYAVGGNVLG